MRKLNFKLIRKTLEWLHRRKGCATLILPAETPEENFRYFKMFGSDMSLSAEGVGDYSEESSDYSIPIHVHGKNLMGGEEFAAIHAALNISKVSTIASGLYSTTPLPDYNGTVIIGPAHVKFKKNTQYTLALHLKYFTSATKRSIALRFDYSDGSYDAPVIASSSREFKLCFTSDANKELVSISSHTTAATNIRYVITGFGLFEGAFSNYDDVIEAYSGARYELKVAEPLRKIEYFADEIDLIDGIVRRKIHVESINDESTVSPLEDGTFEITPAFQMQEGSPIISPFKEASDDEEFGLSPSSDGEKLIFKTSQDVTSVSDLKAYLSENPFDVAYVLKNYITENSDYLSLASFDEELTMEVLTEHEPSKIVAEYI